MRTIDVDTEELAALDDERAFVDLTSFRKIRVSGSDVVTRAISSLSPLLPGTTAGPVSPPLRIDSAVSSRNSACCFKAPWQV